MFCIIAAYSRYWLCLLYVSGVYIYYTDTSYVATFFHVLLTCYLYNAYTNIREIMRLYYIESGRCPVIVGMFNTTITVSEFSAFLQTPLSFGQRTSPSVLEQHPCIPWQCLTYQPSRRGPPALLLL